MFAWILGGGVIINIVDDGVGGGAPLTLKGEGGVGDHQCCGCKEKNTYLLGMLGMLPWCWGDQLATAWHWMLASVSLTLGAGCHCCYWTKSG